MASTGKTTDYELSQFIGTDKPSWLGDYNGDMLKIDTALGSINATATTAQSGVASAQSAASAAQQTANAAQQKATANAQDITKIKRSLTNENLTTTPVAANTDGTNYFLISKNDIVMSIRGAFLINSSGITSSTVSGSLSYFPVQSITGNIFNLSVTAITAASFLIESAIVLFPDGKVRSISIYAYYDGANTVFVMADSTTSISSFPNAQVIVCSSIVLSGPSGYGIQS